MKNKIINEIEKIIKELQMIDDKYYNQSELENMFEIAICIYCKYGELPIELNAKKIYRISKMIKKYDTILNEELNENIEIELTKESER